MRSCIACCTLNEVEEETFRILDGVYTTPTKDVGFTSQIAFTIGQIEYVNSLLIDHVQGS